METCHLIFDADDTLWENNVYFERAIAEFLNFLDHTTLDAGQVRATLDEIEHANAAVHGYGSVAFARNLRQCYEHLVERAIRDDDLATVMSFGERILRQPLELIVGVETTLAALAPRHDLVLLTKGHPEEQRLKIDRSGLGGFFRHVAVAAEKNTGTFRALVDELSLPPDETWMIGNSPRSDVNPALAAGLGAVYIPHPHTWRLEHEAVPPAAERLMVLHRFADLLTVF